MDRDPARMSNGSTAGAASPARRRGTGWTSRTRLVEQVRQTQSRLGGARRARGRTSTSR